MSWVSKIVFSVGLLGAIGFSVQAAYAAPPPQCKRLSIDVRASKPLRAVELPPSGRCVPKRKNGFPVPDPSCTPGAINPTLTLKVLKAKGFTTKCVRNRATSLKEKRQTYAWYKIRPPRNN